MEANNKKYHEIFKRKSWQFLLLFNYCKYLKIKSAIPLANSGGTAFPTC